MQIAENKVATIHYTLTDNDGQTLDSSSGGDPLAYLHGAGNIIPGLEKALEGKVEGDTVSVTVEPGEGYGERNEDLVQSVPRAAFEGVDNVEAGMQFEAQSPDGNVVRVTVTEVGDDQVTVDANHPLAGQTLNFDVEVAEVREASEEEKGHGHVHG